MLILWRMHCESVVFRRLFSLNVNQFAMFGASAVSWHNICISLCSIMLSMNYNSNQHEVCGSALTGLFSRVVFVPNPSHTYQR